MRAKLYRGTYYAVWTEGGRTRRASLRTTDREAAERALADFQRALAGKAETVAEIVEKYPALGSKRTLGLVPGAGGPGVASERKR